MRALVFAGVEGDNTCSCCFGPAPIAARIEGAWVGDKEYKDALAGPPMSEAPERSNGFVLICRECAESMVRAIKETP